MFWPSLLPPLPSLSLAHTPSHPHFPSYQLPVYVPKIDKMPILSHPEDGKWGERAEEEEKACGGEGFAWESLYLDPDSGGRGRGEVEGEDNWLVTAEGWPSTEHPPPPLLNARMAHATRVSEVMCVCVCVCVCVSVCIYMYMDMI
jgi:hypothetical protein